MEERGMNERVKKLRKLSVDTQPHIDLERAKSMTKTYENMKVCFLFQSSVDRC